MILIDSARQQLRLQTTDMHDQVDAIFSVADLSSRAGYTRFLQAQAAAHLAVEQALTDAGAAEIVTDWADRLRAPLLRSDLADLGVRLAPPSGEIGFGSTAATIGGVYVLEGSRLGGTLLRRSVAPGLPVRFLSAGDSLRWRSLLQLIDDTLRTEAEVDQAVIAARQVFAVFARSGRTFLQDDTQ